MFQTEPSYPKKLRQLPPTITADETPEWLPAGWIVHSKVLKRGRQTKTYTHLRTGKKFHTKDHVIEFIRMDKIREHKESAIQRRKAFLKALQDEVDAKERRASRLQDDLKASVSFCTNPYYEIYDNNMSSGLKTHPEEEVLQCQNTQEPEAASSEKIEETGSDYITYDYNTEEEEWSENEYVEAKGSQENVETFSNITPTPLRLQPERMTKLESRAITQCLLEDEENIEEAETSKADNDLKEARVVSHLVESFGEGNLQGVMVDKASEIPGLTGTFSIEINLNCEPLGDSLVERDLNQSGNGGIGTRNIEIREQESDLMHPSASPKAVEATQESGDKSEEPLRTQATQEETANELRGSVLFPCREAPSHSVHVFESSNARSSADGLSKTIDLGLNPCPDTPQEKNISGSKKRKKSAEPSSSKNIKKKDTEAQTDKLGKGKRTPRKPQGGKASSSVNKEKKPVEWPEPCPNFPFEPLTTSADDDSVIRMYLEQYFRDAGSADSNNVPLPDFGLPSFSDIKVSQNELESKKNKSPDPTCIVQVASPSVPCCVSMVATMKQTVAGN